MCICLVNLEELEAGAAVARACCTTDIVFGDVTALLADAAASSVTLPALGVALELLLLSSGSALLL